MKKLNLSPERQENLGNTIRGLPVDDAVIALKRDLVLEAAEDYFRFSEVERSLEEILDPAEPAVLREAAIGLISDLLEQNLISPSDLRSGRENFKPWGISVAESISRVQARCLVDELELPAGEIAWFEATDAGHDWARRYYDLVSELRKVEAVRG